MESEFIKAVTENIASDTEPYEAGTVLYDFGLVDYQGKPTDLALDCGLPYHNPKMCELIGNVADNWYSIRVNYNHTIKAFYLKEITEKGTEDREKVEQALTWDLKNVNDFQQDYIKCFTKLYEMVETVRLQTKRMMEKLKGKQ